jgi:hypothetical protein
MKNIYLEKVFREVINKKYGFQIINFLENKEKILKFEKFNFIIN